jgi:hypothetical protein
MNLLHFSHLLAQEIDMSSSKEDISNLYGYSKQLINDIEHEQYEQAKEIVNKMIEFYLNNNTQYDYSIEAHKIYTEQLIMVKNELAKYNIDREILQEEALKLNIASEVFTGLELTEFSKYMKKLFEESELLLSELNSAKIEELQLRINNIETDFIVLSCALQIMYPIEYHTQLISIINHLKKSNHQQLMESKSVVEYLVMTLNKLNRHTKEAHVKLVYSSVNAKTYLLGISAIIAIAILTVFRRKMLLSNG